MASSTIDLRIASAASRKSRSRIIIRIAIVVAALAIAASLALLPDPAKAASSPVVINMADKQPFYTPEKAMIKVGDTVKWVNNGETVHSVSTSAANAQNPNDTSMPKGATAFDSGFIPPGGDYSYTFTVPGTYRYFCLPHEKAGMVGMIVVKK
jgi:plastocyanin